MLAKGKPEIDKERCKGCELCVGACPEAILDMALEFNLNGHHYAVCADPQACTACLACAIICPDSAIEIWRYLKVG